MRGKAVFWTQYNNCTLEPLAVSARVRAAKDWALKTEEMEQKLRALSALAKVWSSVPSTLNMQFTTACTPVPGT